MIKNITISNIATIKNISFAPYQVNYMFGGNGSGKTTISKYLANLDNYTNGTIVSDSNCDILVYNKDFVDLNFSDKNAIKGIFTIGETAVEATEYIESKEKDKSNIEKTITTYGNSIDALQTEINQLLSDYEQNCWSTEKQLGEMFSKALVGFRGSAKSFAQKVRDSYSEQFFDCSIDSLSETYKQIYDNDVQEYDLIKDFEFNIQEFVNNHLLSQSIVKSSESNFSRFIELLGNVNWVSQGLKYTVDTDVCPFCQQIIPEERLNEIRELFDETYTNSITQLQELKELYKQKISHAFAVLDAIICKIETIPFLPTENFKALVDKFKTIASENESLISKKINEPASKYELSDPYSVVEELNNEIGKFNELIQNNNKLSKNLKQARKDFSSQLWNYIANNRLHSVTEQFLKNITGKNNGMQVLMNKRDAAKESLKICISEINEKRSSVVCIDNTISEINSLLAEFGFKGFKIEKKDELSYRLIRSDGQEVKESLSEGEHRFITFLYFYELIKGAFDKDQTIKNKILVIDDPISSLDSNILFIVSYLVRDIIGRCLNGSNIEQVFVLTHNIYFHQEICFKGMRGNISKLKEHFWIIRKINEETQIAGYEGNQIHSSYELLWNEYKNPNTDAALICNTMRRILEHYFNVIGNLNYEEIIDKFSGQDKLICKTLLSYINAGSHTINDDFHLSISNEMVDKYKGVFKKIFESAGQLDHYNMMMRP